jgi:carboxylesterase
VLLVGAVAAFIALAVWRSIHIRRLTSWSMSRRQLGADGVVVGGNGFVLERANAPAILLLHGAGDTPQTLRYLARDLHSRGFHVKVPLLPGHGRSITDFARVTADDLLDASRANYRELVSAHEWVGVVGLSMGGALAVTLAAESPTMPVLGLIAPYLCLPPRVARAADLSWLWGWVAPVIASAEGTSILNPDEAKQNLAYGIFTVGALRALRTVVRRAFASLPDVAAPTLIVQSRMDNRIDPSVAERALARLGAKDKRLEWITGAAHVITVDYGYDHVIAVVGDWMSQHAPAAFHAATSKETAGKLPAV